MNTDVTHSRRQAQDFDLNLAPIIDCFTVLITFVMITTAFASVGIMDAGIIAGGERPLASKPEQDVRLRVELQKSGAVALQLSGPAGKDTGRTVIPSEKLGNQLVQVKARWPQLKQATLAAGNDVPYREVVAALEVVRKTVPGVSLGGF